MTSPPPLPRLEASSAADGARRRLAPKSRFFTISLPNIRAPLKGKQKVDEPASSPVVEDTTQTIKLNVSHLAEDDEYKDKYLWAMLYENQRGLTIFSIPYYSSNSLLPSDPDPFTLPSEISLNHAHQPNVSLKEYPLPDGNWHWVSKSWMVDMRTDSGEVQHDGFEYNWMFRSHHWHAKVGKLSAGGWVRRRRWMRLMMRPGKARRLVTEEADSINALSPLGSSSIRNSWNGWEQQSSAVAPSIFTNVTSRRGSLYLQEIWQGNVAEDWRMCREVMRASALDGVKLDLWKRWLGLSDQTQGKQRATDDNDGSVEWSPVPPHELVIAVLREKLTTILKDFFIFPESRRRFLELLFEADVFDKVSGLEHNMTLVKALDFWSLNSELHITPSSPHTTPVIHSSKSLEI